METGKLKLQGLSSQEDADKILRALNEVWGVRNAEVNVNHKEAVVSYDEKAASLHDFEQAIIDTGYDLLKQ
ncbi:heavy-metal-associated domain-containing protein [Robertmurraya massiliosenegalensis]|uniref:heavy-metal-associated domain-containing protein n=1 Tax=Robertmurraya TaxID=2837507 RepID=UPI0039A65BF7